MIALISDIHSNIEALEAVFKDIDAVGCDRVFCLGDIVGYGPNPMECVDLMMERTEFATMGNHDFGLIKMPFGFNRFAREAIEWTKKVMKPGVLALAKRKRWKWLENLPHIKENGDVMFLHASPIDPIMDYVKETDVEDLGLGVGEKIKEIFGKLKRLCFVGHTHKPAIFTDDFQYITPDKLTDAKLDMDPARKYLINIGSVGQPRDHINTSSYVLFDGANHIEYRRVPYDFEKTIAKIQAVESLDDKLGFRLREGK